MAIVTISHQMGSGGGEIARAVAGQLGYRCVGAEMLAAAANAHGLVEEQLMRLGEAKPPFLARLAAETQTYIAVMQSAIYETARADGVVLLGRGGQWLLRGIPHVLRVRIVAPFDVRVRRLAETVANETGRSPDLPAAHSALTDLIRRDDADKAGRMRYLYEREIDDPHLYDVVLNTEAHDHEAAAETIVRLATRPTRATTEAGQQTIADRALAADVLVALLTDETSRSFRHEHVSAESGVVRVLSGAPAAVVESVAGKVAGVVELRFVEMPVLPPLPLA
jgi:cytidylate kinase